MNDALTLGKDFIILNSVDWLVIRSVAEYTVPEIAKRHRTLVVEPFTSLLTALRVAKTQNRAYRNRSGVRREGENLYVYSPPPIGIPGVSRWRWAASINTLMFSWLVRRVARKLGFEDPIVYTYAYDSAGVLKRLPSSLKVYECVDHDETLAKDERHRRLVREREEQTCREADVIISITEELAANCRRYNPRSLVVNGGVDLQFFGRASLPETTVPADMARLPKPVLGYLGGLDPWKMNVDLLKFIAQSRPEWSIALVGFVWYGFDARSFEPCRNIHVLGPKPYDDLPAYVKGMDVALMPFPLNGITLHGDAIKMYEYLAAGKPVVSVPVPAALRNTDIVRLARTPEEFLAAIEASLAEGPDARQRRLAKVQQYSWAIRAQQKLAILQQHLVPGRRGPVQSRAAGN